MSVPVDPAISIIKTSWNRTHNFTQEHLCEYTTSSHFWSSVSNTYFLFKAKYYEHMHGASVGSSISPIVANLLMEKFETKAINTATSPPQLWKRYVDYIFVIQNTEHGTQYLEHIPLTLTYTSQYKTQIQMGQCPFWIHWLHQDLTTHFLQHFTETYPYRPILTMGQPPHFFCKVQSLVMPSHIVQGLWANPQLLPKKEQHIKGPFKMQFFHLGTWKLKLRYNHSTNNIKTNNKEINIYVFGTLHQVLSECFKNICNELGIQIHFIGGNATKSILVAPKDEDTVTQ